MMNNDFQGRLTSVSNKVSKDGDVFSEFIIQHEAEGFSQSFLNSYSKDFDNNVSECMNNTDWKSIVFDVENSHMILDFDGFTKNPMPVELKCIKVWKKEKDDEIKFVYTLIFNKAMNAATDPVFATTYLKRKEEDENGKMKIQTYPIVLKK